MGKYVYAVRDGGWVGKLGRANVAPVLRPRANERIDRLMRILTAVKRFRVQNGVIYLLSEEIDRSQKPEVNSCRNRAGFLQIGFRSNTKRFASLVIGASSISSSGTCENAREGEDSSKCNL